VLGLDFGPANLGLQAPSFHSLPHSSDSCFVHFSLLLKISSHILDNHLTFVLFLRLLFVSPLAWLNLLFRSPLYL
jgi:hypothetical protein